MADFNSALENVNRLLDSGDLSGTAERDAWVVKARAELGLARRAEGVEAFCQVLRIAPEWRPDVNFYTTDERDAFQSALDTCSTEPSGSMPSTGIEPHPEEDSGGGPNKVLIMGAAALGLVIIAVIAASG